MRKSQISPGIYRLARAALLVVDDLDAAPLRGRLRRRAAAVPAAAGLLVRDRGPGFDPGAVPGDRRGVRESIVGRMARHGGTATIHSAPGVGTEVELVLPRATP